MIDVPGPRGRWLVGSLPAYEKDRLGWLVRSRDEYGDLVRLSPEAVVVHGADEVRQVLMATNEDVQHDTAAYAGRRSRAELKRNAPAFMRRRQAVVRSLGRRLGAVEIARLTGLVRRELERLDPGLDLIGQCRAVSGRALAEFAVGPAPELIDAAYTAFLSSMRALESNEARVRWMRRPHSARTRQADLVFDRLLSEFLADRRAETGTVLGDLIEQTDDRPSLRSTVRMVVFSAQGVPGVAMAWLLIRLAEHPEHREAIRAELGDRDVATAIQERLPLTTAFVQEVLRLHPPQWLLSRTVSGPVTVGGHTLAEGQQIVACPYLLHRDKRYWDNPDDFEPARWLGRPDRQAFLPFGAGPRACPGASLAMVHLLAVAALFARDVRFDLTAGGSTDPQFRGLLYPSSGTAGRFSRR